MNLKDKIELIKKYNASIGELDRVKQQAEEYEQFLENSKKMINNKKWWQKRFEREILSHVYHDNNFKLFFSYYKSPMRTFDNLKLEIPVKLKLVDYFNTLTGANINYDEYGIKHSWQFDDGSKLSLIASENSKSYSLYYYCPVSYLTDYLDEEGIKYQIYDDDKVEIYV